MRYCISVLLLLIALKVSALAPVKWNQRYQTYIDMYKDVAIYEMLTHNIPASITIAQGLLESGAGSSDLSRKGNNHFGIKCHDWTGPTMTHDDDYRGECFRVYQSAFDSYEDHSKFLERARYKKLFSLSRTDYVGWAKGLKACGYATNPKYAQMLIDIIQCYKLHELDKAKTYDEANLRRVTGKRDLANVSQGPSVSTSSATSVTGSAHEVRMNNCNYYVIARKGDTFKSIAKEFELSYRKVAKYNERDKKDVLEEGDIVYLEKKRTKADKQFKKRPHIVQPGESFYSIAQKYGVRLKSLYKKNNLTSDYQLHVNDKIRVY